MLDKLFKKNQARFITGFFYGHYICNVLGDLSLFFIEFSKSI